MSICSFFLINIDKMNMKRNMFIVNLPFHIMEVRRKKAMNDISIKGRSEVGRLGRGKYELTHTDRQLFVFWLKD